MLPRLSAVDCWTTPLEQRGVKWLVEHNLGCSCWWRRNAFSFLTHISQTGLGSEPLDPILSHLPPRRPGGSFSIFLNISSHCMESHGWARSNWHVTLCLIFFPPASFKCFNCSHVVCRSVFVHFVAQPGLHLCSCHLSEILSKTCLVVRGGKYRTVFKSSAAAYIYTPINIIWKGSKHCQHQTVFLWLYEI